MSNCCTNRTASATTNLSPRSVSSVVLSSSTRSRWAAGRARLVASEEKGKNGIEPSSSRSGCHPCPVCGSRRVFVRIWFPMWYVTVYRASSTRRSAGVAAGFGAGMYTKTAYRVWSPVSPGTLGRQVKRLLAGTALSPRNVAGMRW
jgi:hypothetical protein